nr:MAG TPA: hypothetical protein [Caudoviricetes sp.]
MKKSGGRGLKALTLKISPHTPIKCKYPIPARLE